MDKATSPENDWMYGGSKATYDAELERKRRLTDNAANMPGVSTQPNAGAYQWDRGLEAGARQNQDEAQRLYWLQATGQGPSAAQAMYRNSADEAIRAQQAMAASARGGGYAASAAQAQAAQQAGQMQLQSANQAAAIRAQEQMNAMGGYANAANAQRQMDQARAAQAAQWAFGNAQLDAGNLDRNQRERMFYEDLADKQQRAQQAGLQGYWTLDNQNYNTQQGMMSAEDQAKWNRWAGMAGAALGAGGTIAGAAISKKD